MIDCIHIKYLNCYDYYFKTFALLILQIRLDVFLIKLLKFFDT